MQKAKNTINSLRVNHRFDKKKDVTHKNHILNLFTESKCQLTSLEITLITDINPSTVTARLSELDSENLINLLAFKIMYLTKYRVYGINFDPDIKPLHLKTDFELLMQSIKSTLWKDVQKDLIIEEYERLKNYKNQSNKQKKGQKGVLSS